MNVNIAIGCDHAGYSYKEYLKTHLTDQAFRIRDFGTHSTDSVDYPDFVHPVAKAIENGEAAFGILICGSANGVAMTANKHQSVRAAICWMPEIAELARQHNNANIICLPARFIDRDTARQMVDRFLNTDFEGGRHAGRVNKIPAENC